jgi:hypothetical protein
MAVAAVVLLVGWAFVQAQVNSSNPASGAGEPRARRARSTQMQPQSLAARDAPRVLIFGDSIADQHGSHAAFALQAAGVETRLMTLWGQGLFTRAQYDMGATNPRPPDGSMMASASDAVAEFDPDVVAIYSNHNYWPPYPRDGRGRAILEGTPAFAAMVRAQLTELTHRLTARGASLYLVEPIPAGGGQTAADNPIWTGYLAAREELGLGVIEAGDALASAAGTRVETLPDCAGRDAPVRPRGDLHLTYFGSGRMGTYTARQIAGILGLSPRTVNAPTEAPAVMLPLGSGYRLVTCDGATFPFGAGADSVGAVDLSDGRPAGDPIVAAAVAPPGDRVWALTRGGRVVESGGALLLGDVDGLQVGERAVGMAATPSGQGYWIATSQGRVERFGDATDLGDARDSRDAGSPAGGGEVVAMAGTPDREGYWLLFASGRVAAFGTARDHGDLHAPSPGAPPVALAPHPSGEGYWILDRAGGVHAYGAARALGSAADQPMTRVGTWRSIDDYETQRVPAGAFPARAVAMLPTESGDGYWVWLDNGAVCRFGDADALGGIHRAEMDEVMLFMGQPYYGEGPCEQDVGFGSVSEAQIDASRSADSPPR